MDFTHTFGNNIPLEGITNIRDLGGIETMDGRVIKDKKLIRSEVLYHITADDQRKLLKDYNLHKIIDFRTPAEQMEKPDPQIFGVRHISVPVLSEAALGMTHEGETENKTLIDSVIELSSHDPDLPEKFMCQLYEQLVKSHTALNAYRTFFAELLEDHPGSTLWHCSAGKDRAGSAVIFLLEALGVDRDTIRKDYLATNDYLKEELDAMLARISQSVSDETVIRGVRIMNEARESYIDTLYKTVEEEYDSMARFLKKALYVDSVKIAKLQAKYLEE